MAIKIFKTFSFDREINTPFLRLTSPRRARVYNESAY